MDAEQKQFFMVTVEIRILAAMLTRFAFRSFDEHFTSQTGEVSLSGMQYGILRTLVKTNHTISELSRHFMLDPSTLVPMIDSLERKGLVARGRDPNDRRRVPLSITEAGIELIHSLPMFNEEDLLFKALDSLGEAKTRELLALLREVIEKMPEGADALQSVSSRLYTLGDNTGQASPGCPSQSDAFRQVHEHMIRRTFKRRPRRSRQ